MKHERCHRCGKSIRDDCCTWGCEGPSLREAAQDSARALAALREDELARLRTALAESQAREAALVEAMESEDAATVATLVKVDHLTAALADSEVREAALVQAYEQGLYVRCQCACHREPGIMHVVACCDGGVLRAPLPDVSAEARVLLARSKRCDEAEQHLAVVRPAWEAAIARAEKAEAEAAALREAYERDERVVCKACEGVGALAGPDVGMGGYSTRPPCKTCRGTGTGRAPLPDPSREVARMLAAVEVAEAVVAMVNAGGLAVRCPDASLLDPFHDTVNRYAKHGVRHGGKRA